ncbi:hypothetical protein CYLTODRAFT_257179 [Cylindrobasidium torrendii FP15055 ss-10]|uniref:F-box domain-containing protein n=1 Tax=Cylindrobasidium torrendii FP15055 ss-10 TaxID=1314674 RepID=A0A0D7BS81_9AGAR|nr:hypothetical protein CYLTODRAFT_257179 [Cylindrobasidium torrendii FP15055 ss-10]
MRLQPTEEHLSLAFQINRLYRPLLPSDDIWIEPNIEYLEQRLFETQDQLAALQLVVDHLQCTQTVLQHQLQTHRSLRSPIHKLPREILTRIFDACLPPPDEDSALTQDGPRWSLQAVCGLWREIIISTPRLWATVILTQGHYTQRDSLTLRRHLRYASDAPLAIGIDCTSDSDYTDLVLDTIAARHEQWMLFEIRGRETDVQRVFAHANEGTLALLQEVYVYSPNLTRLDIPRYSMAGTVPPTLTHISAATIASNDYTCLSIMSSLEEWHLHTSGGLLPSHTSSRPMVYDKIHNLRIDHPMLLDPITVPRLESLLVHTSDSDIEVVSEPAINSLCRFLERSQCTLTSLIIVEPALYEHPRFFSDVLANQRCITELDINVSPFLFEALSHTNTVGGLLPSLKTLTTTVRESHDELGSWETAFVGMVVTRRDDALSEQWKCCKLESVRIDTADTSTHEALGVMLTELVDNGLQVLAPYDYEWKFWEGPGWFFEEFNP